ncbi:MAG: hypothetical protein KAJ90_08080, partial [Desulfobacterales bacterium]|nr:hypothetical protein [Desulfobacterales bacterium]
MAANKKYRRWFNVATIIAVVAVFLCIFAASLSMKVIKSEKNIKLAFIELEAEKNKTTKATKKAFKSLAEANHNLGLALNERAEIAENKGNKPFARLYSLHAMDKLSPEKKPKSHQQAVDRVLRNEVRLPAFKSQSPHHHTADVSSVAFSPD